MSANKFTSANDIVLKNIKFWIADLLKLFVHSANPIAETEAGTKETCSNVDIISRIKTLSVVGVVVGVRNEKKYCWTENDNSSADFPETNRPIVYGKQ